MKSTSIRKFTIFTALPVLIVISCSRPAIILNAIMDDKRSFYFVDFENDPAGNSYLPIGVFDSGTGGLSVMAESFEHEGRAKKAYVFLGDLANMPYGSYALENNTALLIEHVMKDAQFLLRNKYYRSAKTRRYETDKSHVKAIVVACNTATAYSLDTIRTFLAEAGSDIGVIRVIDAGAKGAFGNFSPGENGSIAVMANDGTV